MSAPAADAARLPSPRLFLALAALALGGFGIGSSEFVAMGLLPQIAEDLRHALYLQSEARAVAESGTVISAYALGVVVGAPTIAAFAARLPRKQLLLALLGMFVVGSLLSATMPHFGLVIVARFLTGLPHGAYFGVASLVAGDLMGPGRRGLGISIVLSGLTIANIFGVPMFTMLGQATNWRWAYVVVAGVFALTIVAVWFAVPATPRTAGATFRRELSAFTRIQVWFTLLIGSIGFGGMFAVYSYASKIATSTAGMPLASVPWLLVVFGIGMTIGNVAGGYFADRSVRNTMAASFALMLADLVFIGLFGATPACLFIGLFFLGLSSSALAPSVQARLMDSAKDSQTIAAALNHSALNLGNSIGAALGGVTIAAGFGYLSPSWVGAGLALAGMAIALAAFLTARGQAKWRDRRAVDDSFVG